MALAIAIGALGVVIYLHHEPDAIAVDSILAESLTREIGTAEQRGADVRLADLTDFSWDHVLVADREASHAEIERALGGPWKGQLAFGTGDLLIFVHNGHGGPLRGLPRRRALRRRAADRASRATTPCSAFARW